MMDSGGITTSIRNNKALRQRITVPLKKRDLTLDNRKSGGEWNIKRMNQAGLVRRRKIAMHLIFCISVLFVAFVGVVILCS